MHEFDLPSYNDSATIWNGNANIAGNDGGGQMIPEGMVQAYERDGVIVVPEVLDTDTLQRVRNVIAELVAGAADVTEHTDVYVLEPGHTRETPRVRRIKTPHKVHPIFVEIVRSRSVL